MSGLVNYQDKKMKPYRYTRFNKLTKEYEFHLFNPNTSMYQDELAGTQKLGKLEDIEAKHGLDLLIILKALENGIYVKTRNGISKHITVHLMKWQQTDTYCFFYRPYSHVWFKDYKKTWALKEEDLDEKTRSKM